MNSQMRFKFSNVHAFLDILSPDNPMPAVLDEDILEAKTIIEKVKADAEVNRKHPGIAGNNLCAPVSLVSGFVQMTSSPGMGARDYSILNTPSPGHDLSYNPYLPQRSGGFQEARMGSVGAFLSKAATIGSVSISSPESAAWDTAMSLEYGFNQPMVAEALQDALYVTDWSKTYGVSVKVWLIGRIVVRYKLEVFNRGVD